MYPSFKSTSSSLLLLTLFPYWALATLNPHELRNQVHSLGTDTFSIKDMVLVMNDHPEHETGRLMVCVSPFSDLFVVLRVACSRCRLQDVCTGLESLSAKIVANIGCTVGSNIIVNGEEQQLVFEGVSFVSR